MSRWDVILTLPVQSPPILEFSAADIVWSKVECWKEGMEMVARIPFTRVKDFVRGESNNKDCPTRFHVEARRSQPKKKNYKPKVDGVLDYILYWCSFGPDDHRKGGVVRPSRNFTAERKTPAGRPNTKRGCRCHFIVKRLMAAPSVAFIIYKMNKHVDEKGLPCHGPQDTMAIGTKAMYAPYISDELRLQILSLLEVGVPVETIMQRHTEAVEKQGGPCNRDDLLTHRYVRRLERKIRRSTYEVDSDDAVSTGIWIENHQDHIFFYEDFSDSEPFVLGIQTEWQLQQLIRFGNGRILAADSRFGTNKLKYPIYSLLVFDSNNNAIPVAWIMTPNFSTGEIHRWMRALYDRVRSKDPTWKLAGFIVDDPAADVVTIREVFQCSVLISFWRVRHAWHKNLMKKCLEIETCAEMSRRLGSIVASICRGNGDIDSFESFMEDFVDCSDFLDYFKAIWYPRIEMWTTALKALPLASTEVSAAIECYHTQLKLRLLNEEDSRTYQRADWLVDKLGMKVHSYYWLDEYSGKEDFVRYWRDEWKSGLSSWRMALQIPDSDVLLDSKCAKVISSKNRDVAHVVLNPGSEFAICECHWSKMGNICKHMIKIARVCQDRGVGTSSTSLLQYNRILMNILHRPPNDSVIRDHAIALSVSIQSQLSELFSLGSCSPISSVFPREPQTDVTEPAVGATNRANCDERPSVSGEDVEIRVNENHSVADNHVSGETACGSLADDITTPPTTTLPNNISVEQQLPSNDHDISASDHEVHGRGLESNASDSLGTADGSREEILIDACCDEIAHVASVDQSSGGTQEDTASEMRIDIDAVHSPSPLWSGVTNGSAEKGCTFQLCGVRKIKSSDVGFPLDLERVNGTCHSTKKVTKILKTCSGSPPGNGSLAQNLGSDERVCDMIENGSSRDCINRLITSEFDESDDGNTGDMVMEEERHCGNCNDTVLDSTDSGQNFGIDHRMDVTSVSENSCDAIMEMSGGSPLPGAAAAVDDSSCKALEGTTNNEKLDHRLREENEQDIEVQTDSMDFEMSAVPVEEVQFVGDSSDVRKDGMVIASDVPSVINGVA